MADWQGASIVFVLFTTMVIPFRSQATTCVRDVACGGCSSDKLKRLVFRTGAVAKVCCPHCQSRFISIGYSRQTYRPYCNCDFTRVFGNASKGEECDASNMQTYASLNNMPICCANPYVGVPRGRDPTGSNYVFTCELRGDCWRGSQCASCNQSYVGRINNVNVCCSNCEEYGLILGGDNYCSCNRNPKPRM